MGLAIMIFLQVVIIAILVGFITRKTSNDINISKNTINNLVENKNEIEAHEKQSVSVIPVKKIDTLSEDEEKRLVEITDSSVIARIDNVIPGIAQVSATTAEIIQNAGRQGKVLYEAIIPPGVKLDKSKEIEGAFRAAYRIEGQKGIAGQANLVEVAQNSSTSLASIGAAAMSVASVIVGQYYMTQINRKLSDVNSKLNYISNFQNNEYKGKVFAVLSQVRKISVFRTEILNNEEERIADIHQLKNLEQECIELLGQASMMLNDYTDKECKNYKEYENVTVLANGWFEYQQLLYRILEEIEELSYILHFGTISRKQCNTMLDIYKEQIIGSLEKLSDWHDNTAEKIGVDIDDARRKRVGIDGVLHFLPGLFDEDARYKALDNKVVDMIESQTYINDYMVTSNEELYEQDVRIISKQGRVYYLPNA